MYFTLKLSVPDGMVFLFDMRHPEVVIPDYEDEFGALATDSCVSVPVRPEVEGGVEIVLTDDADAPRYGLRFAGTFRLLTPGRGVALNSSTADGLLELPIDSETVELSVFVDDPGYAARVLTIVS